MASIWGLFIGSCLLKPSASVWEVFLRFSSAYLLVSHGSRDLRPQVALEHLSSLVAQRLHRQRQAQGDSRLAERAGTDADLSQLPLVGTAVLELAPLPLHEQMRQFAERALAMGYEVVEILPLFLLPGVHVMEDIPAELALAQQKMQHSVQFSLRPYLGSHADLGQLLLNPVEPLLTAPQVGKVLAAHGSRRPGSSQPIERVAAQLGALPAYWSVPPSIEAQVTHLVKQGYQQIAVLPYFLFEGGITDAIGQAVEHLRQQFPYAQLYLGRPLGATSELANRVVKLLC